MSTHLNKILWLFYCSFLYTCMSNRVKENCDTCRVIVKNFKKGMDKTAKDHFGGGDTAWEESRLGSFARSETRLLEILENACEGADKESRCHAIVEEYEETIENFWFNKHNELDELETFLCINSMKACCMEGRYGKNCEECAGGAEKPCFGRGKCKGSGTRSGNGKCDCDDGYQGDTCMECSDGYYDDGNKTCSKCDESCESTCTDGTSKGCEECKDGYTHNEHLGCIDNNECDEDDICVEGKYCINSKGSYRCNDCDPACDGGCSGMGRQSCNKCKPGWKEIDDQKGCEDVNECEQSDICAVGTYCKNTEGSHACENCHPSCDQGCTGHSRHACVACASGYEMKENEGCMDVDQCANGDVKCTNGQVCVNKDGDDTCEACHPSCRECMSTSPDGCLNCNDGHSLKDTTCQDIDECKTTKPCNKETEHCNNTPGSYQCKCKKGWVRNKSSGACVKKKKNEPKKKGKGLKHTLKTVYKNIISYTYKNYRNLMAAHALIAPLLHVAYFAFLAFSYKYQLIPHYTVAFFALAYGVGVSYLISAKR